MKNNLLVNLVKNAVGLPTVPSDCCGVPVQSNSGCTCGQATPQQVAEPCCEKDEKQECGCEKAIQ